MSISSTVAISSVMEMASSVVAPGAGMRNYDVILARDDCDIYATFPIVTGGEEGQKYNRHSILGLLFSIKLTIRLLQIRITGYELDTLRMGGWTTMMKNLDKCMKV